MPSFDLRGIRVAKYSVSDKSVTYSEPALLGDAMNCNLELRFAEGRLYAESKLSEYMKLATGGTVSIGVKYIPNVVQEMLYGAKEKTRTISTKAVKGLSFSTKDIANYVGVAFYAPDKIDGETKYTCVFVAKTLFGHPSMAYQTKGDTITFNTPTTTGEFLGDDTEAENLIETAVCDSEEEAIAWTKLVLGVTA
jgi:phi13 family phage major tail protein